MAPGRLRRLTFGLRRLKKKSGRQSGRLDFGLCENPKRNQRTYETKRNFLVLPCSCAPVSPKNKSAESAVQFNSLCDLYHIRRTFRLNIKLGHGSCFASVVSLPVF